MVALRFPVTLLPMFVALLQVPLGSALRARTVIVGGMHTCALTEESELYCWGSNEEGQLGDNGTAMHVLRPMMVKGLGLVASMALGWYHTCALNKTGAVFCWGGNDHAQVGDCGSATCRLPWLVPGITATSLAAGSWHTCALDTSGEMQCWGRNNHGQLGTNTTPDSAQPLPVLGPGRWTSITAKGDSSCALLNATGAFYCWGDNRAGQLGDGTTAGRLVPGLVPLPAGATSLTMGFTHACAMLASGTALCWGENALGQLGDGTRDDHMDMRPVKGLTAASMRAGFELNCAATASGSVACWGRNSDGQLGDGTTVDRLVPTTVRGLWDVRRVTALGAHSCALNSGGAVFCWGLNTEGQLGVGTRASSPVPLAVMGFEPPAPPQSVQGGLVSLLLAGALCLGVAAVVGGLVWWRKKRAREAALLASSANERDSIQLPMS